MRHRKLIKKEKNKWIRLSLLPNEKNAKKMRILNNKNLRYEN